MGADFVVLPQWEAAEVRPERAAVESAEAADDELLAPWQVEHARRLAAPAPPPGPAPPADLLAVSVRRAARSALWEDVRARLAEPRALPVRRPLSGGQRRHLRRR